MLKVGKKVDGLSVAQSGFLICEQCSLVARLLQSGSVKTLNYVWSLIQFLHLNN